jgi:hypothetical protein
MMILSGACLAGAVVGASVACGACALLASGAVVFTLVGAALPQAVNTINTINVSGIAANRIFLYISISCKF